MKEMKLYNEFFESVGDLPKSILQIKNEYTKLTKDKLTGTIDVGDIDLVSDLLLHNLTQTYPNSEIIQKNKRYYLKVKNS